MYAYDGKQVNKPIENAPELIHKTAEVLHVYSGNIVDTTGKTAPGTSLDKTIHFNFENDTYYTNPFDTTVAQGIYIEPKDEDGNEIYYTYGNGNRRKYIEFTTGVIWTITFDDLKFTIYGYQSVDLFLSKVHTYNTVGVLDSKPAYWTFGGSGYTEGSAINRGFTQGDYDEEYVNRNESCC